MVERPEPSGERRLTEPSPMPMGAVFYQYLAPGLTSGKGGVADVAMRLLGRDSSTRMFQRLVKSGVAQDFDSSAQVLAGDITVASFVTYLNMGVPTDEAEAVVDDEIRRLATEGPTDDELAIAVAMIERDFVQGLEDAMGTAMEVAETGALYPGRTPIVDTLAELAAVTADDVREFAATWLSPDNRVALVYEAADFDSEENL